MSAPLFPTYDGDPPNAIAPYRPTAEDFGAELADDQAYPPDPETQPTAAAWNQKINVAAAHARVGAVALIYVRFVAGAPVVDSFSSVSSTLVAGDVTFIDNADGDTDVAWPVDSLPAPLMPAVAHVVEDVEIDRVRTISGAHSARVVTKLGAVGTDVAFLLVVY